MRMSWLRQRGGDERGGGGALRWLVLLVAMLSGVAFYVWHRLDEKDRIIRELGLKLDRVWGQELVADVRVDALERPPAGGPPTIKLTFIQYQRGKPNAEAFRLPLVLHGEEFYIDGFAIRFDREFVEAADALRGKSLFLFRRAFGDADRPDHGIPLFASGGIPNDLKVDEQPSDFERDLWNHFWEIANDPVKAAAARVGSAQGEAPHMKPLVGQVYMLSLRNSGGVEVKPRLPAAVLQR
jgi:hypothetical protein